MFFGLFNKNKSALNEQNNMKERKILFRHDSSVGCQDMWKELVDAININFDILKMDEYKYNIEKYYSIVAERIDAQSDILKQLTAGVSGNGMKVVSTHNTIIAIQNSVIQMDCKIANAELHHFAFQSNKIMMEAVKRYYDVFNDNMFRLYMNTNVPSLVMKRTELKENQMSAMRAMSHAIMSCDNEEKEKQNTIVKTLNAEINKVEGELFNLLETL